MTYREPDVFVLMLRVDYDSDTLHSVYETLDEAQVIGDKVMSRGRYDGAYIYPVRFGERAHVNGQWCRGKNSSWVDYGVSA